MSDPLFIKLIPVCLPTSPNRSCARGRKGYRFPQGWGPSGDADIHRHVPLLVNWLDRYQTPLLSCDSVGLTAAPSIPQSGRYPSEGHRVRWDRSQYSWNIVAGMYRRFCSFPSSGHLKNDDTNNNKKLHTSNSSFGDKVWFCVCAKTVRLSLLLEIGGRYSIHRKVWADSHAFKTHPASRFCDGQKTNRNNRFLIVLYLENVGLSDGLEFVENKEPFHYKQKKYILIPAIKSYTKVHK